MHPDPTLPPDVIHSVLPVVHEMGIVPYDSLNDTLLQQALRGLRTMEGIIYCTLGPTGDVCFRR